MKTEALPRYFGTNNRLMAAIQRVAEADTAEYFYQLESQPQFIPTAGVETFEALDRSKALARSLAWKHARLDGYVAEYGLDQGESFAQLCELNKSNETFGFDAFLGLPDGGAWPGNIIHDGKFDYGGQPPFDIPPNGSVVNGWFSETLPDFDYGKPTAKFIHIDCDVYSATCDVLNNSHGRIVKGTIIVFDDYCNHSNWRQGEYKAWQEFVVQNELRYRYLYVAGMSVTVEVI